MALVKRQSNTTRLMIILAVAVVVGIVGYILAKQFFGSSINDANLNGATSGRRVLSDFGEKILNDSRYTGLQTYGANVNTGGPGVNGNIDVNAISGQPQPFQ